MNTDNLKKFLVLTFLACILPLVSACTLVPQPEVGLKEFIHNLSKEMDCLRYCVKKTKNKRKSVFFLKEPIHLTLSVTNRGNITASGAPPDVFSITGLKANIARTKAGTLDLTLSSPEYCDKLTIKSLTGTKSIFLKKAYYFLQTINNTEYVYIEGEPDEHNPPRNLYRLSMDEIKRIECVLDTNLTIIRPSGCTCQGKKGG